MKRFYYIVPGLITLFLSACTTVNAPNTASSNTATVPPESWATRQAQLANITAWNLQGAIGFQQIAPPHRESASINWQQYHASHYNIRLYGPFGAGAVQLNSVPGKITLVSNNHPQPLVSSNAQNLITKATGWQLPVEDLYYWVRSLPAPNSPNQITLDSANRLSTLQQDGWSITYLDYATVKGIDLPDKIQLTSNAFKIKLVIKNWQY